MFCNSLFTFVLYKEHWETTIYYIKTWYNHARIQKEIFSAIYSFPIIKDYYFGV